MPFSRNSPYHRYFWLGAVNFGFAFLFIESRRARAAERALYQSKNDRAHSTLQQIFLQLEKQLRKLKIFMDDVTISKSKSKKNAINNQSQNNLTEKITEAISLMTNHVTEVTNQLAEKEKSQKINEKAFERKNFAIRTELKCLNEQVKILKSDSNYQMERIASLERTNRGLNLTRIESNMRIQLLEEQIGFSDKEITTLNTELNVLRASSRNFRKQPEFLEMYDSLQCKTNQNHQLESKMKHMANKMEILESGMNSECTICFEHVNADRKWTAFVPCGHRICQPCSETISAPSRGRSQNTCPTCRKGIEQYLVLEGIYEE